MNVMIFEKFVDISKQIEKNIKSIDQSINVTKVDNINDAVKQLSKSQFKIVIADGDNLEGKFKDLVEPLKRANNNSYLFVLFSFNINKFICNGADFCFDRTCNFDTFINILKSIHVDNFIIDNYQNAV